MFPTQRVPPLRPARLAQDTLDLCILEFARRAPLASARQPRPLRLSTHATPPGAHPRRVWTHPPTAGATARPPRGCSGIFGTGSGLTIYASGYRAARASETQGKIRTPAHFISSTPSPRIKFRSAASTMRSCKPSSHRKATVGLFCMSLTTASTSSVRAGLEHTCTSSKCTGRR